MIRNCVNIIPEMTGPSSSVNYATHRIFSYTGRGENNYSLNTTTINGNTISTGTTSNHDGQNVTDAQLKTQSFWESLGYNFESTWKMSSPNGTYKGYPIFKGQEDDCIYEIYTQDDLINLASDVNNGDSKFGCTYVLMNDIVLNAAINYYLPIGKYSTNFAGTFDGNYHVLSNMSGYDISLFKNLAVNGTIKNLIMRNANVRTTRTTAPMAILVQTNNGLIENCHTQGYVIPSYDQGADGKGGIASTNAATGIIRNCFVDVSISGRNRIGGITGKNYGRVENCYSRGNLNSTDVMNGGIVGYNEKIVENCVNIIPVIKSGSNGGATTHRTYRVYSFLGTGINNYSLNTTTINGATVSGGTTSNYNGQNVTDAQLKTQSFWQSIGYDFQNIWKMSSSGGLYKGYPIFKRQDESKSMLSPNTVVLPDGGKSVYPNPTDGVVTVKSGDPESDIKVYDMRGQLLIHTRETKVDLSPYANGIYVFDINGEVMKIVKQ